MQLITKRDILNPHGLTGKRVKYITRVRKVSPTDGYRFDGSYGGIDRRDDMLAKLCHERGYKLHTRQYNKGLVDQFVEEYYLVDKKWVIFAHEIEQKRSVIFYLQGNINTLETRMYEELLKNVSQ